MCIIKAQGVLKKSRRVDHRGHYDGTWRLKENVKESGAQFEIGGTF